ncbi:MAG: ParA family protein, partial [Clostridia bacterium]|nr:ParA family protein [Clostridia bacterium]
RLKEAIAPIRNQFDMILIDCPPSLGLLTLNALTATDTVLMPIQCEYYALEGLSQLTKTIKMVKQALNPSIDIEGVLLTMFDSRTNLSIAVADEVKKFFPQKVYKTVIPRNVRLSEAPSYGQPVNVYDPASRGAEGYRLLAEEVVSKNEGRPF